VDASEGSGATPTQLQAEDAPKPGAAGRSRRVNGTEAGAHSNQLDGVVVALERFTAFDVERPHNYEHINQLVKVLNEDNETDISFDGENYGFWFSYRLPKSGRILEKIKAKYGL